MNIPDLVKATSGFSTYNEVQQAFLQTPWTTESIVVAAPTASGKTITAELVALESVINQQKKAIYTCPLRALASEHYNEFKRKYASQKVRACLSTGDLDSASNYLERYDVIFTTYEKLDSLLRHDATWLSRVGVLIIDEVHELDSNRGPTIEMVITKLRVLNPKIKTLALSATIPNAEELSQWLNAKLVYSEFRPVQLREGVYTSNAIRFGNDFVPLAGRHDDPLLDIIHETLSEKQKQALVFCSTRKNAQTSATKLAKLVSSSLTSKEKESLEKLSQKIENVLEIPSEQCEMLSKLVQQGISFHHAGLVSEQRTLIEEAFRDNLLKVLCATPTLAAGVNTPAFRVIISSMYRFSSNGSEKIPVREYKQMAGRAGRPKYDTSGESIILSKSESEADFFEQYYIHGQLEGVTSQLGIIPILRMHLLACIANRYVFDQLSLEQFFSKTLYCHQYENQERFFQNLQAILKELNEMGFIALKENLFHATPLGQRVSELYIDPHTAHAFLNHLNQNPQSTFSHLLAASRAYEMAPYPSVKKEQQLLLWEEMTSREELGASIQSDLFENPDLLAQFALAKLLELWLSERTENQLLEDFNLQPGTFRQKTERADWLLYCLSELAKLQEKSIIHRELSRLRERLKYGIKEELLPFVQLKGIGRVRARKLYASGFTRLADLKKAPLEKLSLLLGESLAASVQRQLGSNGDTSPTGGDDTTLGDFDHPPLA